MSLALEGTVWSGDYSVGELFQCDPRLSLGIHDIDGIAVRFVKYRRALNFREISYCRKGWIFMLGF